MVATLMVALTLLAGCSGDSSSASIPSGPTTTAHIAQPVSDRPSASAKMICEKEAADDIHDAPRPACEPSRRFKPTWTNRTYSCEYVYPKGAVMRLSVKELSSSVETTAYYNSLAITLVKTRDLPSIGQGAFSTKNGSLVARKDTKVLIVDVSKLPETFGVPADSRATSPSS